MSSLKAVELCRRPRGGRDSRVRHKRVDDPASNCGRRCVHFFSADCDRNFLRNESGTSVPHRLRSNERLLLVFELMLREIRQYSKPTTLGAFLMSARQHNPDWRSVETTACERRPTIVRGSTIATQLQSTTIARLSGAIDGFDVTP